MATPHSTCLGRGRYILSSLLFPLFMPCSIFQKGLGHSVSFCTTHTQHTHVCVLPGSECTLSCSCRLSIPDFYSVPFRSVPFSVPFDFQTAQLFGCGWYMLATLTHTECEDLYFDGLPEGELIFADGIGFTADDYISSECPWIYRCVCVDVIEVCAEYLVVMYVYQRYAVEQRVFLLRCTHMISTAAPLVSAVTGGSVDVCTSNSFVGCFCCCVSCGASGLCFFVAWALGSGVERVTMRTRSCMAAEMVVMMMGCGGVRTRM